LLKNKNSNPDIRSVDLTVSESLVNAWVVNEDNWCRSTKRKRNKSKRL